MKLRHITFTGIDDHTDLDRLQDIQLRYPIAEFGVLTSYHWDENGSRYLNPRTISFLQQRGLNLSLHICGQAAIDAATSHWGRINDLTCGQLHLFRRAQLNLATRCDKPRCVLPSVHREIIIQQRSDDIALFNKSHSVAPYSAMSLLIDDSGGQGIDTPLKLLPLMPGPIKVGYAGGFTPSNAAEKLAYIMANYETCPYGLYWIDMESGVRTNDWLDLDKVEQVLDSCQQVYQAYLP